MYCVFGELDDLACVAEVLLDGGCAVENRTVNKDAHLVSTEVQEDLQAVDGARRGLRGGGGWELQFRWDGL